jgi:hypothetical protein
LLPTYINRNINANDRSYPITKFGIRTATGPIRRHLYDNHLSEWVSGCDRLGIKITAKEALDIVNAFRQGSAGPTTIHRKSFSNEAFVDAISELIIADDLVYNFVFF